MQKKYRIFALQLLTTAASVPLFAATLPNNHQYSLGLELFHYKYRESGVMESKGPLYGLNGAYNFTFAKDFFFQPDFRFAYGRTHYKSNGTGSLKNEPNWLFETRLIFGKRFKLGATTQLDPFLGLGYRFKSDDTEGKLTTTGHIGYYRRSQYLYIPLGITLHQQLNCNWSLAPTAEFDWFLLGRQRSDPLGITLHHKQKKGFGLKGDLMLTHKFTKSSLSFGPFVNYWRVKDSKIALGFYEPRNKTIEAGIKVKYHF